MNTLDSKAALTLLSLIERAHANPASVPPEIRRLQKLYMYLTETFAMDATSPPEVLEVMPALIVGTRLDLDRALYQWAMSETPS